MEDADLVRQVLQGNLGAYDELVTRYVPQITARCRAMIWRHDVVDDMVQETFLKAMDKLASLRDPSSFGAWLFQIARNQCRDWRNNHQYEHLSLDVTALQIPAPCPDERPDRVARVRICIRRLPERLREVIEIYYGGCRTTYQEIADRLGIPFGTVNQLLTRRRKWIRRCMENDDSNGESPSA